MENNCFYSKYGIGDKVRVKLSGSDRFLDFYIDQVIFSYSKDFGYRCFYQCIDTIGSYTFDDDDIICYVMEDN